MSESSPKPSRDRTPIYLALIAAASTIVAALIAVLPNVLGSSQRSAPPPQPTVIVITATLAPATSAPLPTATTPPTPTTAALLQPSATFAGPSPTTDTRITFLLINNFDKSEDFYIDENRVTQINSGNYKPLRVLPGTHDLKNCLLGSDPNDTQNCFSQSAEVTENPYFWQISGDAPLTGDIILLLLNQFDAPRDIFIDNSMAGTVPSGDYLAIPISAGSHSFQPCPVGETPVSNPADCGARRQSDLEHPVETYTILGQ